MLNGNFMYSFFAKISTLIYNFGVVIEKEIFWEGCGARVAEMQSEAIPFNFNFIISLINYVAHIVCPDSLTHFQNRAIVGPLAHAHHPYWDIVSAG